MRRITVMVCVAALLLSGCSSDERAQTVEAPEPDEAEAADEATEPDGAEAEDVAVEPQELDLQAGLLELDDMPPGWTQMPTDEDEEESGSTLCEQEPLDEIEAIDRVSTQFSAGDLGPFLDHTVALYDDGEAAEAMEAFLATLNDCDEWTEETEDGLVTYRPTPLSFPSLGDETVATRLTVEGELITMTIDMITWRRGDVLSLLLASEAFDAPDGAQTAALAETADERLADLG